MHWTFGEKIFINWDFNNNLKIEEDIKVEQDMNGRPAKRRRLDNLISAHEQSVNGEQLYIKRYYFEGYLSVYGPVLLY